jgi:hypothetical protein
MQRNDEISKNVANPGRRNFLCNMGQLGLGAAAVNWFSTTSPSWLLKPPVCRINQTRFCWQRCWRRISTPFYYNGLVGGVIQDSGLAGPGERRRHRAYPVMCQT